MYNTKRKNVKVNRFRFPLMTFMLSTGITLFSCADDAQNSKQSESQPVTTSMSLNQKLKSCNIEFCGITFTDAINNADSLITFSHDKNMITMKAGGEQDYFRDQEGKNNKASSPILLKKIDNEKPFTFTAKVTPEFTENGVFNAGVLFVYANDSLWHKLCFEDDFKRNKRVISVHTEGTCDDSAHDIIDQPYVYMKIVSNTKVVISYYSLDGKTWERARIYKNNFPKEAWIGIGNQCPRDTAGSISHFEELSFTETAPQNLRLGV